MTTIVPPVGNPKAKLCFIGEAPGEHEADIGKPFVGRSGRLLRSICESMGFSLDDCYVTNVFKEHPPNNNIGFFYDNKAKRILNEKGQAEVNQTIKELQQTDCKAYVLLGDTALSALTDFKGINKYRGYIVDTYFGKKAIPTIHPSAVLRQYSSVAGDYNFLIRMDILKALRLAKGELKIVTDREYIIPKSVEEKISVIESFEDSEYLSVDIECTSNSIICVGLANSQDSGACITFMKNYQWQHLEQDRARIWQALSRLLHGSSKKIGQNIQFDYAIMGRNYRIRPVNVWCDTMIAHHVAWPELKKGLDVLASLYTVEEYWKDDTKDWSNIRDWDQLYRYNIKDVCITYDIAFAVMNQLEKMNLESVYQDYLNLSLGPVLKTVLNGVNYDRQFVDDYTQFLQEKLESYQDELAALAGEPLNPNSPKQVAKFIYETLGYPKQYSTKNKKKSLSTDENAIAKCLKIKDSRELRLILACRRVKKLLSTYAGMTTDIFTNRMHTSYNVCGTDTGRLSSSRSPFGSGGNLQNLPRPATEAAAFLED